MSSANEELKKINEELERAESSISSLSFLINDKLTTALTNNVINAQNLSDNFKKGKNITKDLDKELERSKRIIEISYNKQNSLQKRINDAIITGNKAEEEKLKIQKDNISLQIIAQQQIDTQLRTLQKIIEEEENIGSISKFIRDKVEDLNKEYFTTLGVLKFIVDAILKSDEQTTSLAKSFGVTKDAAKETRDNMISFSRAANSSFVNVTRLFNAQQALTEQLGIAVDFGGKEQEQFSRLTEIVGLSADEAGKLAKFSAATGISTDRYVAGIRKSVFFAERANKIHVSDKEILSSISKLSAGILIKFQNNPEALAKAVVQAKALGTSLEQVDKIGDSLLDWQSSIQNELEAELITNRKINIEKARYAALTGDQTTLMQELANQVGSLANYQNMNVIAQQSLAKAFGMSREEMADILIKQEAINSYGSKAAEMNAQQLRDFKESGLSLDQYLEKQDKQRSIQEKFNDAVSKLQDLIGNLVAGPLGRMLDIMISITEHTKLLAALASAYIARLIVINALKARQAILEKASAGKSIVKAVAESVGSAAMGGPLGWIVGAGLAAGLYATLTGMLDKADDAIIPGYGKRMLFDKGSITAFNDNDTIVAGTNLKPSNNNNNSGDNNALLNAINNLQATVRETASRPAIAYINGKDAFADNIGKSKYLGTSQNINTAYKLA